MFNVKRFRANYVQGAPDFNIINLVDNPLDTPFVRLLEVIKQILESTQPSSMSHYLQHELTSITAEPYEFIDSKLNFNKIGQEDINNKSLACIFLPTAIIRFQLVLIELLRNYLLEFGKHWNFNILLPNQRELEIFENISYREEFWGPVQVQGLNALELAINNLSQLLNGLLPDRFAASKPLFSIKTTINAEEFVWDINAINLDFSLFNQTEKDSFKNAGIIYIRTDFSKV